jgi:hypothetical protein
VSGADATRLLCITLLCLGPAPGAGADVREQERPPETAAGPTTEVEALAAGRRAKEEGDLSRAQVHFQKALAAAERGGEVYEAALEELTYHLPLIRVERQVNLGQWQRAEQSLLDLAERHKADEQKSRHLVEMITALRVQASTRSRAAARERASAKVVEQVELILERFLAEHERYPDGYRELNEVLPANRYPLVDYDIVHYVGGGRSYGLTLRSKSSPHNTVSVQKTGLVR